MGAGNELVRVVSWAFGDPDGLFEAQSDEAREEEGAEGVDMEGHEVFGFGGIRGAILVVDEGVARVVWVPG